MFQGSVSYFEVHPIVQIVTNLLMNRELWKNCQVLKQILTTFLLPQNLLQSNVLVFCRTFHNIQNYSEYTRI